MVLSEYWSSELKGSKQFLLVKLISLPRAVLPPTLKQILGGLDTDFVQALAGVSNFFLTSSLEFSDLFEIYSKVKLIEPGENSDVQAELLRLAAQKRFFHLEDHLQQTCRDIQTSRDAKKRITQVFRTEKNQDQLFEFAWHVSKLVTLSSSDREHLAGLFRSTAKALKASVLTDYLKATYYEVMADCRAYSPSNCFHDQPLPQSYTPHTATEIPALHKAGDERPLTVLGAAVQRNPLSMRGPRTVTHLSPPPDSGIMQVPSLTAVSHNIDSAIVAVISDHDAKIQSWSQEISQQLSSMNYSDLAQGLGTHFENNISFNTQVKSILADSKMSDAVGLAAKIKSLYKLLDANGAIDQTIATLFQCDSIGEQLLGARLKAIQLIGMSQPFLCEKSDPIFKLHAAFQRYFEEKSEAFFPHSEGMFSGRPIHPGTGRHTALKWAFEKPHEAFAPNELNSLFVTNGFGNSEENRRPQPQVKEVDQTQNAVDIQRTYRGFLDRKLAKALKETKTQQDLIKKELDRKSAITIQTFYRQKAAKKDLEKLKAKQQAAIKIQAQIRGHLEKIKFKKTQKQIVTVQAEARKFLAVREYQRTKKSIDILKRTIKHWHENWILRKAQEAELKAKQNAFQDSRKPKVVGSDDHEDLGVGVDANLIKLFEEKIKPNAPLTLAEARLLLAHLDDLKEHYFDGTMDGKLDQLKHRCIQLVGVQESQAAGLIQRIQRGKVGRKNAEATKSQAQKEAEALRIKEEPLQQQQVLGAKHDALQVPKDAFIPIQNQLHCVDTDAISIGGEFPVSPLKGNMSNSSSISGAGAGANAAENVEADDYSPEDLWIRFEYFEAKEFTLAQLEAINTWVSELTISPELRLKLDQGLKRAKESQNSSAKTISDSPIQSNVTDNRTVEVSPQSTFELAPVPLPDSYRSPLDCGLDTSKTALSTSEIKQIISNLKCTPADIEVIDQETKVELGAYLVSSDTEIESYLRGLLKLEHGWKIECLLIAAYVAKDPSVELESFNSEAKRVYMRIVREQNQKMINLIVKGDYTLEDFSARHVDLGGYLCSKEGFHFLKGLIEGKGKEKEKEVALAKVLIDAFLKGNPTSKTNKLAGIVKDASYGEVQDYFESQARNNSARLMNGTSKRTVVEAAQSKPESHAAPSRLNTGRVIAFETIFSNKKTTEVMGDQGSDRSDQRQRPGPAPSLQRPAVNVSSFPQNSSAVSSMSSSQPQWVESVRAPWTVFSEMSEALTSRSIGITISSKLVQNSIEAVFNRSISLTDQLEFAYHVLKLPLTAEEQSAIYQQGLRVIQAIVTDFQKPLSRRIHEIEAYPLSWKSTLNALHQMTQFELTQGDSHLVSSKVSQHVRGAFSHIETELSVAESDSRFNRTNYIRQQVDFVLNCGVNIADNVHFLWDMRSLCGSYTAEQGFVELTIINNVKKIVENIDRALKTNGPTVNFSARNNYIYQQVDLVCIVAGLQFSQQEDSLYLTQVLTWLSQIPLINLNQRFQPFLSHYQPSSVIASRVFAQSSTAQLISRPICADTVIDISDIQRNIVKILEGGTNQGVEVGKCIIQVFDSTHSWVDKFDFAKWCLALTRMGDSEKSLVRRKLESLKSGLDRDSVQSIENVISQRVGGAAKAIKVASLSAKRIDLDEIFNRISTRIIFSEEREAVLGDIVDAFASGNSAPEKLLFANQVSMQQGLRLDEKQVLIDGVQGLTLDTESMQMVGQLLDRLYGQSSQPVRGSSPQAFPEDSGWGEMEMEDPTQGSSSRLANKVADFLKSTNSASAIGGVLESREFSTSEKLAFAGDLATLILSRESRQQLLNALEPLKIDAYHYADIAQLQEKLRRAVMPPQSAEQLWGSSLSVGPYLRVRVLGMQEAVPNIMTLPTEISLCLADKSGSPIQTLRRMDIDANGNCSLHTLCVTDTQLKAVETLEYGLYPKLKTSVSRETVFTQMLRSLDIRASELVIDRLMTEIVTDRTRDSALGEYRQQFESLSTNKQKIDFLFGVILKQDHENRIYLTVSEVKLVATLLFPQDNIGILFNQEAVGGKDVRNLSLYETNATKPIIFYCVHSGGVHFEHWRIMNNY